MIRSLQHVALTVPDIEAGEGFFSMMGLEGREDGSQLIFRCAGRDQDQVRLIPGATKEIAWICFGTEASELDGMARNLDAANVPLLDAPDGGPDGLWFRDPVGYLVNVTAARDMPQSRPAYEVNNPGQPYARLGRRGAPNRNVDARPRRLGHLLAFTTDIEGQIDFYTGLLGMQLSDRIGDDTAAFLRCGGDSDHHTLALATSSATGLHHLSWEMGNIDQLQICAERMLAAGYRDGWGFGRHIYGSNYFHYVRDPWMSLNEFYWDIDFIPEDAAWEIEYAPLSPEALSQWATTPAPDDFLTNFEAAA